MRRLVLATSVLTSLLTGCVKGGTIDSLPITLSLPSTVQEVDGGGKLTFQVDVENDFSVDGVKWTLAGPGTLTSPSSGGIAAKYITYYNAPADVATTTKATLTATSQADQSKTISATITVYPTVVLAQINPSPTMSVGKAISFQLPGTGGSGSLSYAVTAGSFPHGLLLNSTGQVTGTPTTTGAYSFTIQVQDEPKDTVLGSATQDYTFTVS